MSSFLTAGVHLMLRMFGEDITVIDDARAPTVTRTIRAIVDRLGPVATPGTDRPEPRIYIEVANHASDGIAIATADLTAMRVRMAERLGSVKVKDMVPSPADDADGWHDPGMLRLRLR
jgi:hypothetical protein